MSPAHRFAMLAAWLEGYAEGLPDYCTNEKFKIKEAAELLMEVYEQRMKEKEEWKQHAGIGHETHQDLERKVRGASRSSDGHD